MRNVARFSAFGLLAQWVGAAGSLGVAGTPGNLPARESQLPTRAGMALPSPPACRPANASVAALAREFSAALHSSRYMESTEVRPARVAGWEGFDTKQYTYQVRDRRGTMKTADVIMLNPSAEQIARWIVSALEEVKGTYQVEDGRRVFRHILAQSGGQFPVAGVVYEDILPADGLQEVYCFRNGVTVAIDGIVPRTTAPLTPAQRQTAISGTVVRVYQYARIQSTSPQQYLDAGGTGMVLAQGKPTLQWLDAVREQYQKAWRSNRNQLLVAWVKDQMK